MVHRRGLYRRAYQPFGALPPERGHGPLHPRRTDGLAHSPERPNIYVTEGIGLVQWRGAPAEVVGPGDRVFFEPGEDHWHGAVPTRVMSHLSMVEFDEQGNGATWGAHVTDDEYGAAPPMSQEAE